MALFLLGAPAGTVRGHAGDAPRGRQRCCRAHSPAVLPGCGARPTSARGGRSRSLHQGRDRAEEGRRPPSRQASACDLGQPAESLRPIQAPKRASKDAEIARTLRWGAPRPPDPSGRPRCYQPLPRRPAALRPSQAKGAPVQVQRLEDQQDACHEPAGAPALLPCRRPSCASRETAWTCAELWAWKEGGGLLHGALPATDRGREDAGAASGHHVTSRARPLAGLHARQVLPSLPVSCSASSSKCMTRRERERWLVVGCREAEDAEAGPHGLHALRGATHRLLFHYAAC